MFFCHACGKDIDTSAGIGFREECSRCGAQLHVCLTCRHYAPGMHNDCRETQSDRVVDKSRGNFCEYFQPADREKFTAANAVNKPQNARAQLDALFSKKPR